VAVAALQVVLITPPTSTWLPSYLVLGILGFYTLIWVFLPHYRSFRVSYPGLGVDVVLSALPLFLTGGLASPFLLYSLCPVIYAAFTFPRLVALGCACFNSACLAASLYYPNPYQVSFGFAGLYIIACFLIGIMPYTTNLDIYRRLERDTALKERRKLARELHDTVVQTLAYVNVKASLVSSTLAKGNLGRSLKELEYMKESLDDTYDEVRHTIETLGRSSPGTVDFVTALSHQVNEFSRKSGVKGLLSVSGNELKLSPQAADELLHIVGEAMVNARNHAEAKTVEVGVSSNGARVEVTIKDDGCGFDLPAYYRSEKTRNHHGMTIMRERAEYLGGELVVASTPGNGTEIKVNIPVGVNNG
jgi:signal transduction histidine kinase